MGDRIVHVADRRRTSSEAPRRVGIAWQQAAPRQRWLLVQGTAMLPCVDRGRAQRMDSANRRDWWLLAAAATAGCR